MRGWQSRTQVAGKPTPRSPAAPSPSGCGPGATGDLAPPNSSWRYRRPVPFDVQPLADPRRRGAGGHIVTDWAVSLGSRDANLRADRVGRGRAPPTRTARRFTSQLTV